MLTHPELLLETLTGPLTRLPAAPSVDSDEDLHLALYLCCELHYRGLPGVDDDWEWEPCLLALRAELEARLEATLRRDVPVPSGHGAVDLALREIEAADEYGGGDPQRIHAQLFADAMDALGLDSRYGAYIDRIPAVTLATVNLMSTFGLHSRLRGAGRARGHRPPR